MSSRRNFIRQLSLLGGAFAMGGAIGARSSPEIPVDHTFGEDLFWSDLRGGFLLERDRVYLNNGTMGVSPRIVLDTLYNSMREVDTEAKHGFGEKEASNALAGFLQVTPSELALTHNVTEGINIVCAGLPLQRGDEVVLTTQEHIGNAGPWINRHRRDGIVLKLVKPGATADETFRLIREAIGPKTRLIAVPHILCTTGQVLPVKDICSLARSKDIWSCIDGAHGPGMVQMDLKDLGCDFYASCCHKWMLGPKGTGFLYVNKDKINDLQICFAGAGVDSGWELLDPETYRQPYNPSAHRFYYGTQNESLYLGIESAIGFLTRIGMVKIQNRVCQLSAYLQEQLIGMGSVIEMLTPVEPSSRAAIVSFRIKGRDMKDLHAGLIAQRIITRYVAESGLDCLRVSTHIYNSYREIDIFLDAVERYIYS